METNKIFRAQLFEIIENQIKNNHPVETNFTYGRLIKMGYTDFETMQLIGQCLSIELLNVMKHKIEFDEKRHAENLKQLPKEPFT
jgi:hypothetical protein